MAICEFCEVIATCDAVLHGAIELTLGVALVAALLVVAFIFMLGIVKLVDSRWR